MNSSHHENVIVNTKLGIRFWKSAVDSNGYVPFHWHSSIEIVCVINGKLSFTINGKTYKVEANEFIIVPSGVVHDVTNSPNIAYVLQIPLSALAQYIDHPEQVDFQNGLTTTITYKTIVSLIKELGNLIYSQPLGFRFDSEIVFLQLLKLIFTKLVSKTPLQTSNNRLKDIIIFINKHYYQKLSVNGLAKKFGYNPSYLSRLFKEQTGISLINYIYEVKINQFYQDIINTNIPIKELLLKNGLTNMRTTRKDFKNMFGVLPNDIRRKNILNIQKKD